MANDTGRQGSNFPEVTLLTEDTLFNVINESAPILSDRNQRIKTKNILSTNLELGASSGRVDLKDISPPIAGTYTNPGTVTVDSKGRVTGIVQGGGAEGITHVNVGAGLSASISLDGTTLSLAFSNPAAFLNISPLTTKGDVISFNGTVPTRVPINVNNGYVMTVDNTAPCGFDWKPAAGGGAGISDLIAGAGFDITSPSGPTSTIGFNVTTALNTIAPTTTKGDIIAYNGSANVRLAVGSNGMVLSANSGAATGLAWIALAPAVGGITGIVQGDGILIDATAPDTPTVSIDPATALGLIAPTTTKGDLIVYGASGNVRLPLPVSPADGLVLKTKSTEATGLEWGTAGAGGTSVKVNGATIATPNFINGADPSQVAFTVDNNDITAGFEDMAATAQSIFTGLVRSAIPASASLTAVFASIVAPQIINTTYDESSDLLTILISGMSDINANLLQTGMVPPCYAGGANALSAPFAEWFFLVGSLTVSPSGVPNFNTVTIVGNPSPAGVATYLTYSSTTKIGDTYVNLTIDPYKSVFELTGASNLFPVYDGSVWKIEAVDASNVRYVPQNPNLWPPGAQTVATALSFLAGRFILNKTQFDTSGLHTFTVPTGISKIYVTGSAGGGGGAAGGGGGGAGAYDYRVPLVVVPGTVLNVTVGVGGAAGTVGANTSGVNGDPTAVYDTNFSPPVAVFTLNGGGGGFGGNAGGSSYHGGNPGNSWASAGVGMYSSSRVFPGGTNPVGMTSPDTFQIGIPGGYGYGGSGVAVGAAINATAGGSGILIIEY